MWGRSLGVIKSQWPGMWGQERDIETGVRLRIVEYLPIGVRFSMGCPLSQLDHVKFRFYNWMLRPSRGTSNCTLPKHTTSLEYNHAQTPHSILSILLSILLSVILPPPPLPVYLRFGNTSCLPTAPLSHIWIHSACHSTRTLSAELSAVKIVKSQDIPNEVLVHVHIINPQTNCRPLVSKKIFKRKNIREKKTLRAAFCKPLAY